MRQLCTPPYSTYSLFIVTSLEMICTETRFRKEAALARTGAPLVRLAFLGRPLSALRLFRLVGAATQRKLLQQGGLELIGYRARP